MSRSYFKNWKRHRLWIQLYAYTPLLLYSFNFSSRWFKLRQRICKLLLSKIGRLQKEKKKKKLAGSEFLIRCKTQLFHSFVFNGKFKSTFWGKNNRITPINSNSPLLIQMVDSCFEINKWSCRWLNAVKATHTFANFSPLTCSLSVKLNRSREQKKKSRWIA